MSAKIEKEREVWIDIIDLYKEMTLLWDTSRSDYHNKDLRNHAYSILHEKYKTLDENATITIFKKKLENMRTSYVREKKKVKSSTKTGASAEDIYVPKPWYFDLFNFLDDKTEISRKGQDTLENSDEENISTINTPPPPITKKTSFLKKQEKLLDTTNQLQNQKDEEWTVMGKSIGFQLKDLDKTQQAIAYKIISDALFYAKMGKLTEYSAISLNQNYLQPNHTSSSPCSISSPSLPASTSSFLYRHSPSVQHYTTQTLTPQLHSDQSSSLDGISHDLPNTSLPIQYYSIQTPVPQPSPGQPSSSLNILSQELPNTKFSYEPQENTMMFDGKAQNLKEFVILKKKM